MKHLNLLVLRSTDIEAARRFYELLGLSFTRHAHGSGPEHYAHEDERGVFEIYPVKAGGQSDTAGVGSSTAVAQRIGSVLVNTVSLPSTHLGKSCAASAGS